MRGATRSKAAHLQVVLATDLTAVLRGDEADGARAVGLQAEMRAARAEVAAGHASICLPHDRKGQELRRGLAQPLGYPCPETPCLPSSSRRASRRHRGCSKSCRDLCRGEEMALYDVRGGGNAMQSNRAWMGAGRGRAVLSGLQLGRDAQTGMSLPHS